MATLHYFTLFTLAVGLDLVLTPSGVRNKVRIRGSSFIAVSSPDKNTLTFTEQLETLDILDKPKLSAE